MPFTVATSGTYYLGITGDTPASFSLQATSLNIVPGTDASERLEGTSGDDLLRGLAGDDRMFGGPGNDILEGGAGVDIMNGGPGDDVLFGNTAANNGTDGLDILRDNAGGNDKLYGEAGDDLIEVYRGTAPPPSNIVMDGGSGNDSLIFEAIGRHVDTLTVRGGTGGDTILIGGVASSNVDGGSGNDSVTIDMSGGRHRVTLGSGADTVRLAPGEAGQPTAGTLAIQDFDVGTDRIELIQFLVNSLSGWDFGDNPFSAGYLRVVQSGADTLLEMDRDGSGNSNGFATLITFRNVAASSLTTDNIGLDPAGIEGNYSYYGYTNIYSGEGVSEWLPGGTGANFIDGGGGNDFIQAGPGGNILSGGRAGGSDTLMGNVGDDILNGSGNVGQGFYYWGPGSDLLVDRFGGDDQLLGGGGNDELYVARSGDMAPSTILLDGKSGRDVIIFDAQNRYLDSVTVRGSEDWVYVGSVLRADIQLGAGNEVVIVDPRSRYQTITLGGGGDKVVLQRTYAPFEPGTLIELPDFSKSSDYIYIRDYLRDVLIGWDGVTNPFTAGYLSLRDGLYIDPDAAGSAWQPHLLLSGHLPQARFDVGDTSLTNFDQSMIGNWSFSGGQDSIQLFAMEDGTVLTVGNIRNHAAFGEALDITSNRPVITGTGDADTLNGTSEAEILLGLTGDDRMAGGGGDDIYVVDATGDIVIENPDAGNDTIYTRLLNYALPDNIENLTIEAPDTEQVGAMIHATGNAMDNIIIAKGWGAVIDGGAGADLMVGYYGDDTYYVDNVGDVIDDVEGSDTVYTSINGYMLPNSMENLIALSNDGQELIGNPYNNRLIGGAGDDILTDDAGNDWLDGGAGADIMSGGRNNDTYIIDNVGDRVIEIASGGNDDAIMTAFSSFTLGDYIENLTGTSATGQTLTGNSLHNRIAANFGADILRGEEGNDFLTGGPGADQLFGDSGNDRLEGNADADMLYGGLGDDELKGGDGADLLDGGLGKDKMTGGAGADIFRFSSAIGSGNIDAIADFSQADDSIALSASIFTQVGAIGALDPAAFHAGSVALDAQDRILFNQVESRLYYDADGNGTIAPILFATFDYPVVLSADNFQVVA
nr:calcium-binding protein [Sphingobium sp. OAS761]